jgi:drug/metabolite transporter (DMT)-like permease
MNLPNYNYLYFYAGATLFYIADVLQKKTSTNRWTWSYLTIRSIYTFIISFTGVLFLAGIDQFPDTTNLLAIIGCSVICGGGLFFYIKAVNLLHFSNAGSLYIVGNVVQHIIGTTIFHEIFHWTDIPAMLLMSFGCVYQLFTSKNHKGAVAVLLSTLCWSVGYTILSLPLKHTNIYWSVPIMEGTILIICFFISILQKEQHSTELQILKSRNTIPSFIIIGLSISLASYFNNVTYSSIPVSVISFLQLSLLPVTFLLSMRIFREKLSLIEWISFGTGFTGFGIYILGRI